MPMKRQSAAIVNAEGMFSNPATWFYLIITGLLWGFCSWRNDGRHG